MLAEKGPELVIPAGLTQALMRSARRAQGPLQLVQQFSFTGRLSADEKVWYKRVARESAFQALTEVIGG